MNKILKINRYGINGEGIAVDDNKIVFVKGALVNEDVDCTIIKSKNSYSIAKLNKVINVSPNRTTPVCPYFETCGGCDLQHMNYNEQLLLKKQIVQNNINKIACTNCTICDIEASDKQFNYRNHMTFAVSTSGKLGFFKNNSHDVVIIKSCYLADKVIDNCINIFNSYLFDNGLTGFNYKTGRGDIKQVDIKYLNNQLLITVVANINELPNLNNLCVRLNLLRIKYGIYLSINNDKNTIIYGKLKHLYGIKNIETYENNILSQVSSFSFVQVNNYIKTKIYDKILNFVSGDIIIDAFSGRGVLSMMLASTAKKVYAIEIMQSSHKDATIMLQKNNIKNVQCICGDIQTILPTINENIDCIVLDPPRKGISEVVINKIIKLAPKKLVYLSCASNTLARDLKILLNNYKIIEIKPYDMFPQTNNIETLVFLEKINEN